MLYSIETWDDIFARQSLKNSAREGRGRGRHREFETEGGRDIKGETERKTEGGRDRDEQREGEK